MELSFFDTVYDRRNTGSVKYMDIQTESSVPVIPMWVADMDFKSPPAVTEALLNTAQHGIYGYGETDEEYDAAVSEWYGRRMGWTFKSEHILKVPGVVFGTAAAVRAVTQPGDSVLICQPVYYPFAKIIAANGRNISVSGLVFNGVRYEIDFDDFERRIKRDNVRAFLLCSPHNPVSRVWTREELAVLARICFENDVYIISDEIHSDFVFSEYGHIPFASLSEEAEDRTITCISPTKTFNLAGLQAANIICSNDAVRKRIQKECLLTGYGSLNIMAAAAVKAAYRDGEAWLDTLLVYLRRNIALLDKTFSKDCPVSFTGMEGTYLAWLDCRKLGLSSSGLDGLFLNKAGIWLHNGSMFGAGGEGFMRMNIACPRSVIEEALKRITDAV